LGLVGIKCGEKLGRARWRVGKQFTVRLGSSTPDAVELAAPAEVLRFLPGVGALGGAADTMIQLWEQESWSC
jgi:hypothetical protein